MTDFIYDNGPLPTPKTDLAPLPAGADPTKFCVASDYNALENALFSCRTAIKAGEYHGLAPQAIDPLGSSTGVPAVWLGTSGQLYLHQDDGTSVAIATGASAGNAVLNSSGTVTVLTSLVTSTSVIILTRKLVGGTIGTCYGVSAVVPGTSFTITSYSSGASVATTDTSTISWLIVG